MGDQFDDGAEFDADYARQRQKWQPLFEVIQIKGASEAHPLLSPDDSFADYELWDNGNLDLTIATTLPGECARAGLIRGLRFENTLGVNPFKFGMAGGTDTDTGLSTVEEDNCFGKFASCEPNPKRTTHGSQSNETLGLERRGWQMAAMGLTATWATENTRPAIWDAMARRETYATTGPCMTVRFFGG